MRRLFGDSSFAHFAFRAVFGVAICLAFGEADGVALVFGAIFGVVFGAAFGACLP